MAKINWGAGFSLNTPELLSEAREREEWGDGKIVTHNEHPRWVPAQGRGILAVPSVPKREENGRKQRPTTEEERRAVAEERKSDTPTEYTLKRLKERGPTCIIQRLVTVEMITAQQAQALSQYAALRRRCGRAERAVMTFEGRQQPQAPGREPDTDNQIRAERTYKAAYDSLTSTQRIAVTALCDQRPPRNMGDAIEGAKVLERFFVHGEKSVDPAPASRQCGQEINMALRVG